MAAKPSGGLGRGLGSLIPDGNRNVSRETSRAMRALDLLVPSTGESANSTEGANAHLTRELLRPGSSKRRVGEADAESRTPSRRRGSQSTKTSVAEHSSQASVPAEAASTDVAATDANRKGGQSDKGRTVKKSSGRKAVTGSAQASANSKSTAKRGKSTRVTAGSAAAAPRLTTPAGAESEGALEEKQKVASGETTEAAAEAKTAKRNPIFADIIGDAVTDEQNLAPAAGTHSGSIANFSANSASQPPAGMASSISGVEGGLASEQSQSDPSVLVPVPGAQFGHLPIDTIIANRRQPRDVFDEEELAELAESIKEVGVLQPIVVRALDVEAPDYQEVVAERIAAGITVPPLFELIMGERRLRASMQAGREMIPAIIKDTKDNDLLRDALLENLHRSQLNPLEEAAAYQQLMEDFGCTQQELSAKIARSRSQIANTIRLLKLPGNVQRKLAAGVISAGHARALLSLESGAQMAALAERIVSEGLSVRSTEEIVSLGEVSGKPEPRSGGRARAVHPTSAEATEVIDHLEEWLDTRVTVQEGKTKGRIIIEFAGHEDLARLMMVVRGLRR